MTFERSMKEDGNVLVISVTGEHYYVRTMEEIPDMKTVLVAICEHGCERNLYVREIWRLDKNERTYKSNST